MDKISPGHGNSLEVEWLELCPFTSKGPGSIPGWGTKILQTVQCGLKKKSLGHTCKKASKLSKATRIMSKGHRSQPEGAPTGQRWDNLSMKKANDSNRLKPIKYIHVHKVLTMVKKKEQRIGQL